MPTVRRIHAGLLVLTILLAGIGPAGAGSSAPPGARPASRPRRAGTPCPGGPADAGRQPRGGDRRGHAAARQLPPRRRLPLAARGPGLDRRRAQHAPGPGRRALRRAGRQRGDPGGPRAFVRGAYGAQIGLDNQEPDFVQLRVTAGYAAVDLRELQPGHTVELDTPGAAFTMERAGYYHAEVSADATTFRTASGRHRDHDALRRRRDPGGREPAGGGLGRRGAPAWRRAPPRRSAPGIGWNYQRTDYLIQPASAKYVPAGVYGGEALDQHGSWRSVESYGSVWVPAGVPAGWSPYTTGRWIWDPRFGWTWLDEAPWGWAPYHYGRWVFVGPYWAWAPGPDRRAAGLRARPRRLPRRPGGGRPPALLGPARLGRAGDPLVGRAALRGRGVVGRLGRAARRQQRGDQSHDHGQRDEHHRLSQREA